MYNKFERFDSPNLFLDALKNGISLFCGAGFSILACDSNRNNLPVGNDLLNELKKKFEYVSNYSNLPRACTKIKNSDKGSFYDFLEKRFAVANFDPLYLEILNVNIKSIYTTNIDDLFYKIFSNSKDARQLLDRTNGDDYNNDLKIDYYPLHGCIRNNKNYVFGAMEIASAFSQRDNQNSWKQLSKDSARNPILFWGWNFEDSGPIEAMYGSDGGIDNNSKKWVLLYKPSQETVDFLESLNFNIIIGDTTSLLKYIHENNELIKEKNDEIVTSKTDKQLKKYSIPNNDEKLTSYSIKSYFLEYTPRWSYVYSNQIPKLKAFNKISEDIASGKDVIIIGMRCSGKTTLMMQLLANNNTYKPKHYLIAPSVNDVETYSKLIGDMQTILFVDDCFRDTNAVIRLLKSKNIQTVLFDRDFNYERQYHKIQTLDFRYIDVTAIEREDSQKIIDSNNGAKGLLGENGLVIRSKVLYYENNDTIGKPLYLSYKNNQISVSTDRINNARFMTCAIADWTRFGDAYMQYVGWTYTSNDKINRAMKNYTNNTKIGLKKYGDDKNIYFYNEKMLVINQSNGNFSDDGGLMFADVPMHGVICELMAAFNAATLAGENVNFFKTAAEFEYNALVLDIVTGGLFSNKTDYLKDGFYGSNPDKVSDWLDSLNLTYKTYKNPKIGDLEYAFDFGNALAQEMDSEFTNGNVAYFSYKYESSIELGAFAKVVTYQKQHSVAGIKDDNSGMITTFNRYSNYTEAQHNDGNTTYFNSIDEIANKEGCIFDVGYLIQKK